MKTLLIQLLVGVLCFLAILGGVFAYYLHLPKFGEGVSEVEQRTATWRIPSDDIILKFAATELQRQMSDCMKEIARERLYEGVEYQVRAAEAECFASITQTEDTGQRKGLTSLAVDMGLNVPEAFLAH